MAFRCLTMMLCLWPGLALAQVFNPTSFTLDNGMRVVVVENHRAPVVTHMVWYRVGSADEVPGKTGLAHFFEHLMFRGTEDIASGEFSRIIARNGGRDNAFTSFDYTAYFQNIAADRLGLVMEMEADRMVNLDLSDDVVLTERDVILEERRQVIEARPERRFSEALYTTLFVHHPYGTPVIGWRHEIAALTPDDARSFYRQWYAPNNAILVVSGAVEPDEVQRLAEATYGQIPAGRDFPPRTRPAEPRLEVDKLVTLRDPQVEQPQVTWLWHAPNHSTVDDATVAALEVLFDVLGGGATSRLYRGLVEDRRIATAASAWYWSSGLDPSHAGVFATPTPDSDIGAVEAAIEEELARLLADGVSEAEVAASRQRLIDAAVFARDSLFGPARIVGMTLTTGGDLTDIEDWPTRVAAVTPQAVMDAARLVLADAAVVRGHLMPGRLDATAQTEVSQ